MPRTNHGNTSQFWSDRGLPGLSLLRADFTTHEYAPHSHDGLVIAVTEEGGAVIRSGSDTLEARPGLIFISNPGEIQSAWMGRSSRWRYRSFYVAEPALSRLAQYLGLAREARFACSALADARLCNGLLSLHRKLASELDALEQTELLTSTLAHLFLRHAGQRQPDAAASADRRSIDRVLEHMRQCFQDSLELADLAEAAGITVFQLIRRFRQMTGFTPHAYLTQLRLDAARDQLKRGTQVADAAVATGFYDQSALTKHFKRAYGITPGQFASAVQRA